MHSERYAEPAFKMRQLAVAEGGVRAGSGISRAAVIAAEHNQRVILQSGIAQLLQDCADGVIALSIRKILKITGKALNTIDCFLCQTRLRVRIEVGGGQ
jgi:hypothetical protein